MRVGLLFKCFSFHSPINYNNKWSSQTKEIITNFFEGSMFFSRLFAEKTFLGFKKRKENNKQLPPKNHLLGSFCTSIHTKNSTFCCNACWSKKGTQNIALPSTCWIFQEGCIEKEIVVMQNLWRLKRGMFAKLFGMESWGF